MRIHRIMPVSRVNGPGARFVVWVQGCSRRCPGCFNPLTHPRRGGYELSVGGVMRQIPLCDVEGITVSGGEPFEQAGELVQLLEAAKEAGLHRLVYTGFLYEELADMKDDTIDRVFAETNILIDGAYQQNNPSKAPWIGSGNQRILFMDKGKTGEAADAGSLAGYAGDGEIWIDHSGNVTATGIFDSRALGKAV